MAIYPHATKRLLHGYDVPRGGSPRVIALHSTAGGASSPYGHFANGGACSAGWVGYKGEAEVYMDSAWKDAADLYSGGGPYVYSLETASNVNATDAWTDPQLAKLIDWVAWGCKEMDIPARQARWAGDSGIGWHRLGIDGNFPSGLHGGRLQIGRGDHWSTSFGKGCPGDKRIDQVVQELIPEVLRIVGGVSGGGGKSVPTPSKPKPSSGKLAVDGSWGPATTRALQKHFGTAVDGVISGQKKGGWNAQIPSISWGSGGSQLVAAMQKALHITQDGYLGPDTVKHLQKHEGTTQDGVISNPSQCVMAMQRHLNGGSW